MIFEFTDCELDTERMELRRSGSVVSVEPQVFDLLRYFIEHPDRVLSKDEIHQRIWQGRIVSDSALSSRIKSARKAIGDSGDKQEVIKTVHGRGFRFAAEVRARPPQDDPRGSSSTEPSLPAIAILPFRNLSGDPQQEYFSDGLAEDIITALTRWRSFPVLARNSSFAFKDRSLDVRQIGRELGARYLLAGSVRKSPSELRVSVQLIDGPTGRQIWAQRYDRRLADIFEVQDDIVEAIAATVAPKLARAEVQRSTVRSRQDLDVWDLCLRGMACIQEMSLDGNARARDLFEEAVTIRQDYADAYSGVAMSHNQDALFADSRDRRAHAELALAVAQKAVALDGASALAHRELSTTYQLLDRRDDAMAEARLAVELNPHDAFALHSLGNMLDLAGHAEGIALMEKAQRLNPEDTQAYTHPTYLARAYFNAGNMDQAVERARKAVRRNPDYAPAYYIMALALAQLGHDDDAARMLAVCDALQPGFLESRETWQPYADAARNEKLREALLSVQALRRR